ncbi:HET-domain-containing protein [Dichomitus squalens LYAD-421 SS1]|uniref:HET-domain-containing protein n=1 Tax=Dichomitus squalens (strain LYAD-421) TaxID=732165 RepID=R7SWG8_DICSQ|nr:HET-domain-containing protein [Dichomitus squalens LYAD-421 SS1]EJF60426.1 HET-domain-containing protein [Dichomitus squalens LYAD-421 SS1]
MWLLRTDRAELVYFPRNFDADGGYAILSHTWDEKGEQTFQDVRNIGEQCKRAGRNPRDDPRLSPKIRECCRLAEKHGFRWAWADSCCIDKTSSSELSESINSMFRWYSDAEECYAYLADVPGGSNLHAPNSAFRKSRWHTRGWTLQELIAPASVRFYSCDWEELGNRADLAELLADITGIALKIFTRETRPSEYSVCMRMSWASQRQTTRLEDEAYCLMGLFDISMPTNYGEGEKAFMRLQHEIMQRDPDLSLFAWGYRLPCGDLSEHGIALSPGEDPGATLGCLLASSPRGFDLAVCYTPHLGTNASQPYPPHPEEQGAIGAGPATVLFGHIELPRISITTYGIKLRLPVFEADGVTVAVLLCEDYDDNHLGLFISPGPPRSDPTRPRYYAGCQYRIGQASGAYIARLVSLGDDLNNLQFNGKPVEATWRTIYVVPSPPDGESSSATTAQLTINCVPCGPFRLPHWLVSRFLALGFTVTQTEWDERAGPVTRFIIHNPAKAENIYLDLGICRLSSTAHWSKVTMFSRDDFKESKDVTRAHSCKKHHIDSWNARSKVFPDSASDADRSVRLSFTPCKASPRTSKLVVHMELMGRVYEDVLREANMTNAFLSVDALEKSTQLGSPIHAPFSALLSDLIGLIRRFHPRLGRCLHMLAILLPLILYLHRPRRLRPLQLWRILQSFRTGYLRC